MKSGPQWLTELCSLFPPNPEAAGCPKAAGMRPRAWPGTAGGGRLSHSHRHCSSCLRHFGASDGTSSMNTLSTNAASASLILHPQPPGPQEHQSQPCAGCHAEWLQDRKGARHARAFQVPPKQLSLMASVPQFNTTPLKPGHSGLPATRAGQQGSQHCPAGRRLCQRRLQALEGLARGKGGTGMCGQQKHTGSRHQFRIKAAWPHTKPSSCTHPGPR